MGVTITMVRTGEICHIGLKSEQLRRPWGRQSVCVVVLLLQLYALSNIFIALVGSNENLKVGNVQNLSKSDHHQTQIVNKIVIVIIDAMRFDFIPQMEFVYKSLNKNFTCLFQVSLDGPTVTLPRIKAIVSGATSSYWEILTNLKQSSQMAVDNFIWRANSVGKDIVFYGDDTWLKLFPSQNEFKRKEGVTSFFVTDFYEVDNNVTRNVDIEIRNGFDFDMMILHYLGVDHVGHVYGPKHPLIPSKLKEMDGIIENIYNHLVLINSSLPHTIFITGDHGMANQGGHGGDSFSEVTTPLVILTVNNVNDEESRSICKSKTRMEMKQVDIASTISSLWGLPFPANSRGIIPSEIISQLSLPTSLSILDYLATHLSKFLLEDEKSHMTLLQTFIKSKETYKQLLNTSPEQNYVDLVEEYERLVHQMSKLAVQNNNQDLSTIAFSILLLFQTVLILIMPLSIGIIHLSFLVLSSIASFIISIAPSPILLLPLIIMLFLIPEIFKSRLNFWNNIKFCDGSGLLLNLLNFVTPLLYFSSSFVEEEHLPTYYLYATAVTLSMILLLYPICSSTVETTVILVSILSIHRFCAGLNATGQKWNYLPDFNDLISDHSLTDSFTMISFILLILFKFFRIVDRICAILICCFKLNISRHFGHSDPSHQTITQNSSHYEAKLCYLLILASLLSAIWTKKKDSEILVKGKVSKKKNDSLSVNVDNAWILLCCLLQRKENIVLIPLLYFQVKLIQMIQTEISNKKKNTNIIPPLIHLLAFSSFFYQGNSNNITTIDISLGYTGLSTYNEYLVGSLTFIATFSLPILIVILSCCNNNRDQTHHVVNNPQGGQEWTVITLLVVKIVCTNFVYSIVLFLMRQHLFIWSVFVPKLLYLIAFTFLTLLISLVDLLLCSTGLTFC